MSEADFPLSPDPTPPPTPLDPPGDYFQRLVLRVVPPWLLRARGARYLQSTAAMLDELADRTTRSAQLRFPTATQEDALPAIGRDRKIQRGPSESASSYVARLRVWLDAHANRGGPYALLGQLYGFHGGARPIDLVSVVGVRYVLSTTGEITRESGVVWLEEPGADVARWARVWVIHRYDADPGALTATQRAQFLSVPLAWNGGHSIMTVGLAWDGFCTVWDYAWTATWDELDALGLTWDEFESRGAY